jgi:hypothetical protein
MKVDKTVRGFGRLQKARDGKVFCHICRKSFHNLGNHVRNTHKITPDEYRTIYGLNNGCALCSESLKAKRREVINKHPELVEKLVENGKGTQMRKGVATYTADKVRKQASFSKKERKLSEEAMLMLIAFGKSRLGSKARWGKRKKN